MELWAGCPEVPVSITDSDGEWLLKSRPPGTYQMFFFCFSDDVIEYTTQMSNMYAQRNEWVSSGLVNNPAYLWCIQFCCCRFLCLPMLMVSVSRILWSERWNFCCPTVLRRISICRAVAKAASCHFASLMLCIVNNVLCFSMMICLSKMRWCFSRGSKRIVEVYCATCSDILINWSEKSNVEVWTSVNSNL